MRLTILFLLIAVCSFGQQASIKATSTTRGYLEYLPSGYSSTTMLYPCIIFLHGSGERGNGSVAELERVKAQGPPKFIANGAPMCFTVNGVQECFIVLSPQQNTSRWSWEGNEVIPFIQFALAKYRIDPNRVYLTGLSMGGDGCWINSYSSSNEPNYITAMAPVSCKGDYKAAAITAQRKIPAWVFFEENVGPVPYHEAKNPVDGMNISGANPAPIWTIVKGGGHNSYTWNRVYDPSNTYYTPNVYQWFLTFGTATPAPVKDPVIESYWLDGKLYNKTLSGKILTVLFEQ